MKGNFNNNNFFLVLVVAVHMGWSCNKKEFMPPSIGQKTPYTDSVDITLAAVLAASPHTLFNQAWQRSHMNTLLAETGGTKSFYTLLVPTNNALAAAGWDEAAINQATAAELDSLLMRYTFKELINKSKLEGRPDHFLAASLWTYPNLHYIKSGSNYYFQAKIGLKNGHLMVNGIDVGEGESVAAKNGCIWPINQVLTIPVKTAWEALQTDERFSLYVQLISYTDSLYLAMFKAANGYLPSQGHAGAQVYNRNSLLNYDLVHHSAAGTNVPFAASLNTWFIPENQAFEQAGFYSIDDLKALNIEHGLPTLHWIIPSVLGQTPFYGIVGEFATDTLLDYHHNWGRRAANYADTRKRNASMFYSEELGNPLLNNYMVSSYTQITATPAVFGANRILFTKTTYHYMPFDFPAPNQVVIKGRTGEAANLTEKDIYTLNGVIHGVDRLMVPTGFSLN